MFRLLRHFSLTLLPVYRQPILLWRRVCNTPQHEDDVTVESAALDRHVSLEKLLMTTLLTILSLLTFNLVLF